MGRINGLMIVYAGITLFLCGVLADVIMHELDPMLAATEEPLSLTNPAHVLFVLGGTFLIAGVLRLLAGRSG